MKEDLDEEVQGEEVEPNQGWSLVFETLCFFCEKNLEKNQWQKDKVYGSVIVPEVHMILVLY